MDLNSTCRNPVDPALVLEATSILKQNMKLMKDTVDILTKLSENKDSAILVALMTTMSSAIYDTNSVIDALLTSITEYMASNPNNNI